MCTNRFRKTRLSFKLNKKGFTSCFYFFPLRKPTNTTAEECFLIKAKIHRNKKKERGGKEDRRCR